MSGDIKIFYKIDFYPDFLPLQKVYTELCTVFTLTRLEIFYLNLNKVTK